MKNHLLVNTKRMWIQPMSDGEIEALMKNSDSEDLRSAYCEMLAGCRRDPKNRIWYAPWKMTLEKNDTYIGDLGFKGPAREKTVEIGYGILPAYEGKGYTTEAVRAIIQWAFSNRDVVFIEAETDPDNRASQRVLEKCGFTPDGEGKEGPRFVLESPRTNWMTIGMLFGLSVGIVLGSSFGSIGTGTAMGLCVGLCVGAALDSSEKKEREALRERRRNRK